MVPRKRGPVPKLSPDKIADAVVAVGFDRASVTSVSQHLDVTHAALYRHIGDRDGMIRAAIERALGGWDWPELVDDWREVLWNEARSWWSFCSEHPGFVAALASASFMPLPLSRRTLKVASHLQSLGFSAEDGLMVVDMVTDMIHDIFHRSRQREGVINDALTMSPEEAAMHLEGVADDMVEVILGRLIGDPWPWFSLKLELVLDGMEQRITPRSAPA